MTIEQRIINFVRRTNWIFLCCSVMISAPLASIRFTLGILFGGLLVTINFHLLAKTLYNALKPEHLASHQSVIAKYYIRFVITGFIILVLVQQRIVNPLGLILGLSVVVASIMAATAFELTRLVFKEA